MIKPTVKATTYGLNSLGSSQLMTEINSKKVVFYILLSQQRYFFGKYMLNLYGAYD